MAKSGDDGSRWGEHGSLSLSFSLCMCVLVATVAGVVCDDGGEIYTGCQPPNNVIALYKLRERGEHAAAH